MSDFETELKAYNFDRRVRLPTPKQMLGKNAGVEMKTALEYFSTPQPIEFDNLYPVYYKLNPLEREYSFYSYTGIDDFIGALPVKQMYNIYAGVYDNNRGLFHEYIMMLRWLRTSMEISGITHLHLYDRLEFLDVYLGKTRDMLDEHFKCHTLMMVDEALDERDIYLYAKDRFHKERGYNISVYLSMAMNVVAKLAHQADEFQWKQCHCFKCLYYRSPEWTQKQPVAMTPETLPPMQFYRRRKKGVSRSEKIYHRQHQMKKKK